MELIISIFLSDFEERHKDNRILCAFPFFKYLWTGSLGLPFLWWMSLDFTNEGIFHGYDQYTLSRRRTPQA